MEKHEQIKINLQSIIDFDFDLRLQGINPKEPFLKDHLSLSRESLRLIRVIDEYPEQANKKKFKMDLENLDFKFQGFLIAISLQKCIMDAVKNG